MHFLKLKSIVKDIDYWHFDAKSKLNALKRVRFNPSTYLNTNTRLFTLKCVENPTSTSLKVFYWQSAFKYMQYISIVFERYAAVVFYGAFWLFILLGHLNKYSVFRGHWHTIVISIGNAKVHMCMSLEIAWFSHHCLHCAFGSLL